ncbi:Tol-Pal system translocation protein TolB [Campylobacter blaseri]|uniref:Tol-Pal system protein TolB n=1 Tax=Campylobacter blaseri TaxID=2042961 RepID=A0A2P8QZB6_9BACT|nr:Tol-Pal system protein TolB [Campylobacter blaseri]PSM51594.1 Tol-Pal system protein TolB [Campylobacter blaseri]PSM53387.1 Tol-Pal system protein TolB [Campylobacter blaseri]QKF86682.1 Tol-Pal system translocation protein TolB [Campylobacter blaseri]
MRKIIIIFSFCVALFANDATTTIVNQGVSLPKVIVQDSSTLENANLKDKFFKIIIGDLKVGATFDVSDAYSVSSFDGDHTTNIVDNATFIVRYSLSGNELSSINLDLKVLSAQNGKIVYESNNNIKDGRKYPFLAHKAISEVISKIGYANVDWMNKMVLISKYTSAKTSDIIVADYTLTYQQVVLSGGFNIFPKWASAEQREFYYTAYINGNIPTIFKYNISNNRKSRIIEGQGMLAVSDVSSDGTKLAITDAPNDQPDIFVYDLRSGKKDRITTYPGIDVSGNFVDNDEKIVFVSDRLGYPNVFMKNINGGNVEQMVYHGRNNNSISTNGNYIAYSSREEGGVFNLYLISTQTDYIRQLTAGGKNLFPRFSQDGGTIMYIKDSNYQSAVGLIRVNENKGFIFPLKLGKIQSLDW